MCRTVWTGAAVEQTDDSFYYLLHGVIQHDLYHGGQIALLKRATQT